MQVLFLTLTVKELHCTPCNKKQSVIQITGISPVHRIYVFWYEDILTAASLSVFQRLPLSQRFAVLSISALRSHVTLSVWI
jgi:hypothetical protein